MLPECTPHFDFSTRLGTEMSVESLNTLSFHAEALRSLRQGGLQPCCTNIHPFNRKDGEPDAHAARSARRDAVPQAAQGYKMQSSR